MQNIQGPFQVIDTDLDHHETLDAVDLGAWYIVINGAMQFVENEKLAVHLESSLNTVDVCFSLEDKGGYTLLTQHVNFRFKGFLKLVGLLLGASVKKKIKRQANQEFARLKQLCEQG